ncbi:DNA/RNA non-specific endonuclease [Streptomyces sp. NPDC005202]|uniref:DNA/RNA non-specific endonuclease n=1 Tax=Streptomyces sp. NPDC005202 TaxID=3157021 RepID=UPI0033A4D59A
MTEAEARELLDTWSAPDANALWEAAWGVQQEARTRRGDALEPVDLGDAAARGRVPRSELHAMRVAGRNCWVGAQVPGLPPQVALPGGLAASADDLGMALRTGQGGGYGAVRQPPPYCRPLDGLGRAQGVDTMITKSMLNTGSKASRRVKPPGWLGDAADHTRGHLLARSLGGDGSAPENIVIMYKTANNEVMEKLEEQIYKVVDAGHDVKYSATPLYKNPTDLIPAGVRIVAKGGGLDIDQTIINK